MAGTDAVSGMPEVDLDDGLGTSLESARAIGDSARLSGRVDVAQLRHHVPAGGTDPHDQVGPDGTREVQGFTCCLGRERQDIVPNLREPLVGRSEPTLDRLALQARHQVLRVVPPSSIHRDAVRPCRQGASLWPAVRLSAVGEVQAERLGQGRRPGQRQPVGRHGSASTTPATRPRRRPCPAGVCAGTQPRRQGRSASVPRARRSPRAGRPSGHRPSRARHGRSPPRPGGCQVRVGDAVPSLGARRGRTGPTSRP